MNRLIFFITLVILGGCGIKISETRFDKDFFKKKGRVVETPKNPKSVDQTVPTEKDTEEESGGWWFW